MRLHNIQLFRSLIMGNRKRLTLHKWKKENTRKIPVHELRNLRTTFHSSEKEKNFRFERKILQEEKNNNNGKKNIHIWERVMFPDGFFSFQNSMLIWIYFYIHLLPNRDPKLYNIHTTQHKIHHLTISKFAHSNNDLPPQFNWNSTPPHALFRVHHRRGNKASPTASAKCIFDTSSKRKTSHPHKHTING